MAVPRPDGMARDDGVACTAPDVCAAGACVGPLVALCGEAVDLCEGGQANDKLSEAAPLALDAAGAVTALG